MSPARAEREPSLTITVTQCCRRLSNSDHLHAASCLRRTLHTKCLADHSLQGDRPDGQHNDGMYPVPEAVPAEPGVRVPPRRQGRRPADWPERTLIWVKAFWVVDETRVYRDTGPAQEPC